MVVGEAVDGAADVVGVVVAEEVVAVDEAEADTLHTRMPYQPCTKYLQLLRVLFRSSSDECVYIVPASMNCTDHPWQRTPPCIVRSTFSDCTQWH